MSSAGTGEEGAGIGERYIRACLQRFVWQRGRGPCGGGGGGGGSGGGVAVVIHFSYLYLAAASNPTCRL